MSQPADLKQSAERTIRLELQAIEALLQRIDGDFEKACQLILNSRGRVVVVGMGKSGHIGNKIAATLASTGTPAFFVHPAEASHGDMGMITRDDVILALSNSGSTAEIVTLLPLIKRLGIALISMTGNPASPLAQAAEVNLDARVEQEACPLNLAPTASTTAQNTGSRKPCVIHRNASVTSTTSSTKDLFSTERMCIGARAGRHKIGRREWGVRNGRCRNPIPHSGAAERRIPHSPRYASRPTAWAGSSWHW